MRAGRIVLVFGTRAVAPSPRGSPPQLPSNRLLRLDPRRADSLVTGAGFRTRCQWPISYSPETASEETTRMKTDLDKRPPFQRDETVHHPRNVARKPRGREIA